MVTFEFPVAGLASWLCLKSDAIMRRDKAKDGYDVVWIISALGPERVAEQVAASPLWANDGLAGEVRRQLTALIEDQFKDVESIGPVYYEAFLDSSSPGAERRFAQQSVVALGAALHDRGLLLT